MMEKPMTENAPEDPTGEVKVGRPILIDLGSRRRKAIKNLKRGQGKLMEEILEVVSEVRCELGEENANRELLPVIVLYRKRRRGRGRGRIAGLLC